MNLQLTIGLIAFLVTAIGCLFVTHLRGPAKKKKFVAKAKANDCATEGSFTESKFREGRKGTGTVTATYGYKVAGKSYVKKLDFKAKSKGDLNQPRRIQVYFDPENPKKSVADVELSKKNLKKSGQLLPLILPVVVFCIVYFSMNYFMG